MMPPPDWLPSLVLFDGDWDKYVRVLYGHFRQDFVDTSPSFRGARVGIKRGPMDQGKEATFWHIISEGSREEERLPDMRRCERIRWPRPIIEHADDSPILVWESVRGGDKRIAIWFAEAEYLVILARRKGYVLLWTAFPVTMKHRKEKLQKEYEAWLRSMRPG